MKVLVTGANGFVGSRLCLALAEKGFAVRAAVRYGAVGLPPSVTETALIDDIGSTTDWSAALKGADAVIHLAARVHVMHDSAFAPLAEYRKVNTEGTRNLARQAAAAGIKRLVFLSTIKVNGERTDQRPFDGDSPAAPQDAYAVSKAEAEEALRALSTPAGLRPAIIRTPLIYGPGARGNLLTLIRAVRLGLPLPLKNIRNKRSLISLDNLADALIAAATGAEAQGRTFAVCDGQDLSTAELANMMAEAMGRKRARLFSPPGWCLRLAGTLGPLKPALDRLTGTLTVDGSRFRRDLNWSPPQPVRQGVEQMVAYFLDGAGHDG